MKLITRITCVFALVGLLGGSTGRAQSLPGVAGPAGIYQVTVPSGAVITWGPTWVRIDWSASPTPTPTPVPDPTPPPPAPPPTPTPTPIATGKLWVSLVYDPDKATPALATLKDALATDLNQTLTKDLNCRFTAYVITAKELDTLRLRAKVIEAGGPPIILIQEQKDADPARPAPFLPPLKVPATAAEVVTALKQLRGK